MNWAELVSFDNLWQAARRARAGKRLRDAAARFERNLGPNLTTLRDELMSGAYRPGPYNTFTIYEPARRLISAAPYRDRVVHHALCAVIEPAFERGFIYDSYANRKGKGTHKALDRTTQYARQFEYVLQCDIRLFFPSLDHQILVARLARRIGDADIRRLCGLILDNSNVQETADFYFPGDDLFSPFERRRGLPIGNLTSQFWANVYMDPLDHFIKDDLGVKGYLRYVDDFLLFGASKRQLEEWRETIAKRAGERMRLVLHPRKTRIFPVTEGIPFLGFRVWPTHRRLLPDAVKRARRRLAKLADEPATARARLEAWIAHATHGDTWGLRWHLFRDLVLRSASSRSREQGS